MVAAPGRTQVSTGARGRIKVAERKEKDQITMIDADAESIVLLSPLLCFSPFISAWLEMKEDVEQGGKDSC